MRLLMVVLVGLVVSGPAWGYEKDGTYTGYSTPECGEYLDAYAKSTLTGKSDGTGSTEAAKVFSWIYGYVTAYNYEVENGKRDILAAMTTNDALRWVASWCRDNPSKDVLNALDALFSKQ